MIKLGKTNSNANYLLRQRGQEAIKDISMDFQDEFPKIRTQNPEEGVVFYINGRGKSEFQEVIDYLTKRKYLEEFTREEKIVFQYKVAPYTLIRGILFKMGANDQLRRCLERAEWKQVMRALHSSPSRGHFAAIAIVNRIWSAKY